MIGLRYTLDRCEILKTHIIDQRDSVCRNDIGPQHLMVNDELKTFFENEMKAYHVTSSQSDISVARYEIQQRAY